MDEDASELIMQLCTRIGMIMEDHVDAALTIRTVTLSEWAAVLDQIEKAAEEIGALAKAAKVLLARR